MDSLQMLFMALALTFNPGAQAAKASNEQVQAAAAAPAFAANERAIIQKYFRGAAARGTSYTGLQSPPRVQLERNAPLPAQANWQSLPGRLARQLPRVAQGYERIIVGKDVVLVHVSTQTVVDVLYDVVS
jgi:hypothetical protein